MVRVGPSLYSSKMDFPLREFITEVGFLQEEFLPRRVVPKVKVFSKKSSRQERLSLRSKFLLRKVLAKMGFSLRTISVKNVVSSKEVSSRVTWTLKP